MARGLPVRRVLQGNGKDRIMIKFLADWLWTDTRADRWLRYRLNRWYMRRPYPERCGQAGRDHGGVRNHCVRPYRHRLRHVDTWGDKW